MEQPSIQPIMSNQSDEIISQVSATSSTQISKSPLVPLLFLIILLLVGSNIFFAYHYFRTNFNKVVQVEQLESDANPAPISNSSSDIDEFSKLTTTWKTYTNQSPNYSIDRPSDWDLATSDSYTLPGKDAKNHALVVSNGDYKLILTIPFAFGPDLCIFDDESRVDAPEMASFCEGEFVEKLGYGQVARRRLVAPEIYPDRAQWTVYSKNNEGAFVTIPPISYEAPLEFDEEMIELMDQIVASYQVAQ